MQIWRTLALAITLAGASQVKAENAPVLLTQNQSIGLIQKVSLFVSDRVTGKCWTGAATVKRAAQLKLEQSGIAVEDSLDLYDPRNAHLVIEANGKRGSGVCAGGFYFSAVRQARVDNSVAQSDEMILLRVAYSYRVITGTLDAAVADFSDAAITDFAVAVLTARRDPVVKRLLERM